MNPELLDALSTFPLAKFLAVVLVLLVFGAFGFVIGRISCAGDIRRQRKDAVRRSRSAVQGQVAEQVAPLLPGFPCNPADARFVGKPVDFVAFCGLSENDRVDEILFVEVKSGNSALSAREKSVRDAIKAGRVRYAEFRV